MTSALEGKEDHRKGDIVRESTRICCINQIEMRTRGRGSKNPKKLGISLIEAPEEGANVGCGGDGY